MHRNGSSVLSRLASAKLLGCFGVLLWRFGVKKQKQPKEYIDIQSVVFL
jgi:hypothetical protein